RKALAPAFGPSLQQSNVLAIDVTMLTHPLAECVEKMLVGGRRLGAEERDASGCDQTVRLLRLRRKRPRRRAAKRDYEFSSSDAHFHVTLRLGVMHAMEGGYHALI